MLFRETWVFLEWKQREWGWAEGHYKKLGIRCSGSRDLAWTHWIRLHSSHDSTVTVKQAKNKEVSPNRHVSVAGDARRATRTTRTQWSTDREVESRMTLNQSNIDTRGTGKDGRNSSHSLRPVFPPIFDMYLMSTSRTSRPSLTSMILPRSPNH